MIQYVKKAVVGIKKNLEDVHMNYDTVFKEALTLFKDKTLDFLGLENLAPIDEPLKTENSEINIVSEFADLTFSLKDGKGAHFEEEVDLSEADMLRIAGYHIWLGREYKRTFVTVIFVKEPVKIKSYSDGQLSFTPIIVDCSNINADAVLEKLKREISENKQINELEIIYLPLFASKRYSPTELFKESSAIISGLPVDGNKKLKLFSLLVTLVGKVVNKKELDRFWEEVKIMGNAILEYAEERGIQLGEERGIERKAEESAVKMVAKGYDIQEILEITGVSPERLQEIIGD